MRLCYCCMSTKVLPVLLSLMLLVSPVLGQENETEEADEDSFVDSVVGVVTGFPGNVNIISSEETVEDPSEQEPLGGTMFWVVLLLLILLGIVIYSFDIDPLHVLGVITLLLLVSVFILRDFLAV